MKALAKHIPLLSRVVHRFRSRLRASRARRVPFPGSAVYWERRYAEGGNSGAGSSANLAEFKAGVLNQFAATHQVQTVIELGCGDGNQLSLAKYPTYLGFDVSQYAVLRCQELFRSDGSKSFRLMSEYNGETADLALSLDVIYHLVEDVVFEHYMRTLFGASERYVVIYSSDTDDNRGYEGSHIRHRRFTGWVQSNLPDWTLLRRVPNRYPYRGNHQTSSFSDFFIYQKA